MNKQEQAMAELEKKGFKFSNWIPAEPDADNNPIGDGQTAVMVKKNPTPYSRQYFEVDPEGNVN